MDNKHDFLVAQRPAYASATCNRAYTMTLTFFMKRYLILLVIVSMAVSASATTYYSVSDGDLDNGYLEFGHTVLPYREFFCRRLLRGTL
jgi:hypothetical protein